MGYVLYKLAHVYITRIGPYNWLATWANAWQRFDNDYNEMVVEILQSSNINPIG